MNNQKRHKWLSARFLLRTGLCKMFLITLFIKLLKRKWNVSLQFNGSNSHKWIESFMAEGVDERYPGQLSFSFLYSQHKQQK